MYVYWGTTNSGKRHLELLANANNKTTLLGIFPKILAKVKVNTIHYEDKWNENITEEILYHRQKQYPDEFLQTKISQHRVEVGFESLGGLSEINNKTTWDVLEKMYDKKFIKFKNRRRYRIRDDIEEYSKKEYINSMIYYKLLWQNCADLCDPIGIEFMDDKAEEIFDGVDFVTNPLQSDYILQRSSKWKTEQVFSDNVVKILQSAVNIVPYKTNLLDSIISKLDTFSDSECMPYPNHRYVDMGDNIYDKQTNRHNKKGTIYEIYETNKEFLWSYLDGYQTHLNDMITILKQYNIPFIWFNLDEDNYEDIFSDWNPMDIVLPRDHTHFKRNCWEGYEENYKEVEKMAKEYLSRREKSFQTSIKKEPTYRLV